MILLYYSINVVALIVSVIFHELAHGYAALYFGDDTAKNAKRLSLNPVKHLDPIGSVLLPLILLAIRSPFLFGWAKPVPINYSKMRNPKVNIVFVSLVGPLVNILFIILGFVCLKTVSNYITHFYSHDIFQYYLTLTPDLKMNVLKSEHLKYYFLAAEFFIQLILINSILAFFNLIPIPPLDGSRLLIPFLSPKMEAVYYSLERYGVVLIFVLLYFNVFDSIFGFILNFFVRLIFSL
ncbi:MAG: site-2 protease family protein [Candidatus Margulisbacteria bacterium]|nr:site-2 protease family protein [Candidatus Margulisiibacteriota bacterium]